MKKANDEVLAGKVPFRARERCWPVGVPGFVAYSLVEPFYFYQSPEKVVVINQGGPEIRHIYLNTTHSKNVKPSWYGESVGHYENGDTLVIDTIGISTKSFVDNYRTPHTDQLHVVERWKLAADGKTVDVSVFVEDPGAFTTPWTAVQRWRRVEDAPIQPSCATRTMAISSNRGWCRCPKPPRPIFDFDAPDRRYAHSRSWRGVHPRTQEPLMLARHLVRYVASVAALAMMVAGAAAFDETKYPDWS